MTGTDNTPVRDDTQVLFAQLAMWRAVDFPDVKCSVETTSQESDNRVPTLTKSSYRLPAAAPTTADEQQRSYSGPATEPGRTANSGLDAHPHSGLQA